MSFPTHPRGKCMHAECSHGLAGCAAFVVFVNDTLREVSFCPCPCLPPSVLLPLVPPFSTPLVRTSSAPRACTLGSATRLASQKCKIALRCTVEADALRFNAADLLRYVHLPPLLSVTQRLMFLCPFVLLPQ